jgi:hypothetical protein
MMEYRVGSGKIPFFQIEGPAEPSDQFDNRSTILGPIIPLFHHSSIPIGFKRNEV